AGATLHNIQPVWQRLDPKMDGKEGMEAEVAALESLALPTENSSEPRREEISGTEIETNPFLIPLDQGDVNAPATVLVDEADGGSL
ncbi:hypothetical protein CYMTET_22323, partial [Cymbomonas tetramitiformis]